MTAFELIRVLIVSFACPNPRGAIRLFVVLLGGTVKTIDLIVSAETDSCTYPIARAATCQHKSIFSEGRGSVGACGVSKVMLYDNNLSIVQSTVFQSTLCASRSPGILETLCLNSGGSRKLLPEVGFPADFAGPFNTSEGNGTYFSWLNLCDFDRGAYGLMWDPGIVLFS